MPPKVELIPLDLNNPDHVGCLYKVRTHPQVAQYLYGPLPKTFLEHTQYLYTVKNKDFFILQAHDQLCGYCHRTHSEESIELGWALHPDQWGKGIGSVSVKGLIELSLSYKKPLMLSIQKNNLRAYKLYQKQHFSVIHEEKDRYTMRYDPKT